MFLLLLLQFGHLFKIGLALVQVGQLSGTQRYAFLVVRVLVFTASAELLSFLSGFLGCFCLKKLLGLGFFDRDEVDRFDSQEILSKCILLRPIRLGDVDEGKEDLAQIWVTQVYRRLSLSDLERHLPMGYWQISVFLLTRRNIAHLY